MRTVAERPSEASAPKTAEREFPRALFSVPFQLHPLTSPDRHPIRAISVDISQGGIGALVQGSLHVGETVEIELSLAGHRLKAPAIVRYTSPVRCGFQFLNLGKDERQRITRLVGRA